MTAGGSSIPEVRRLLAVLTAGRRAAEIGTVFGPGGLAVVDDMTPGYGPDPLRDFFFGNTELVTAEILTTPSTAALLATRV